MSTKGLERFVESFSFSNKLIKKADSNILKESLNKIPQRVRESIDSNVPEGYWVPVSHYGNYENGNGRIYNTKLWENVIDRQRDVYVGSPMLCDHPEGDKDGNPRDICGVWLDCKMGKPNNEGIGIVYGLLIPSGRLGEDLKDHLKKGLKVGTSSSGFGKLMADNKTVDPETYQIERLADFVLTPSQGTFFSWNESTSEVEDNIHESLENDSVAINENITYIKENTVKDSLKFTKLEEKKFRKDMESFLEDAENIKDPQERLKELKEIRSYLEEGVCPDLKDKIEEKINKEEESIKKILEESVVLKEELGIESSRDLKEKITKLCQDTKEAEKSAKDWKSISEQLQETIKNLKKELEDRPTSSYVDFQAEKIATLNEQIDKHDSESSDVIMQLTKAYKELKESYDKVAHHLDTMTASSTKLTKENKELKEYLAKITVDKDNATKKLEETTKALNESMDKVAKATALFTKERKRYEESLKEVEVLKSLNERLDEKLNSLSIEAKNVQFQLRESRIRENKVVKANLSDTEKFYESLYSQYGNELEPYKEKIAGARTLADAKNYFYRTVLNKLSESKRINDTRLPEVANLDEGIKNKALRGVTFIRESSMSRMPKDWQ